MLIGGACSRFMGPSCFLISKDFANKKQHTSTVIPYTTWISIEHPDMKIRGYFELLQSHCRSMAPPEKSFLDVGLLDVHCNQQESTRTLQQVTTCDF